ncbi:MAG TPA: HAMP domain-containing sensor histidine kinase [Fimbriiglobus sp.]
MRLGLRTRLLVPPIVLLLGIAGATAWAAAAAARHAEARIANQLARIVHTLTEPPTFPLTSRVLEQMKGFSGAEFVFDNRAKRRIQTLDGVVVLPAGLAVSESLGPAVVVGGTEYRGRMLVLTNPPNEGGFLYILYPESLRREAVEDAARPPLVLGAVGGLLSVGLSTLSAGRLVSRIRGLNARTQIIAAGDFTSAPVTPPDDELADLARAVNDMAGKLGEYQDRLKEGERLRVIGQFAGGLAHQIRNAAMGAKLAVEIYEREAGPTDPEPLQIARRQLGRIEEAVKQFLDLGRPTSGPRSTLDLIAVISDSVALYTPGSRHTGTALTWLPPAEPVLLSGHVDLLRHLFANLIGNALDAAGPGGSVEVTLRIQPTCVKVDIADTGPGPSPEIAQTLFDPFVTGKSEGIGLGLAVAKQAVDAHGGTISWERTYGRTVFHVALPRG